MQSTLNSPAKQLLLKVLPVLICLAPTCFAESGTFSSPTNIFAPASTPAKSIFGLSLFVLTITATIFAVVVSLLTYAVVKFRRRADDDGLEPAQVYGSNQVEIAWTVIPVLIDRVVYRSYLLAPSPLQISALQDQEWAGVLMWVSITFIYMVPAMALTVRILSPATSRDSQAHFGSQTAGNELLGSNRIEVM